ncbi:hypothetical protein GGS23DRAFT_522023 [Durotheca rogersii]|uniref:uncharacterized protein n=1 Tax=Durotheca rogersii TaxID=419775 RepID=UPI00221F994C|nr:uncharacterized protein GGS23DRAFT_522023 [Durotheca rogersii]KAI5863934.1 hypothetical protein GGS23DRAFT_522023 [Durotheca rogersii]
MGQAFSVPCQIEIAAPPATVRSVFLDFPRYKEWQEAWTIEPVDSGKNLSEIDTGDSLRVSMHGMVFHPIVMDNCTEYFVWEGSLFGLFSVRFTPSEENPGGTTFIQTEVFRGPLTAMVPEGSSARKGPSKGWDMFNMALKKECERIISGT